MTRLCLMQVDAAYEPLFSVAVRSFLLHNPGWRVVVLDFGLTPEQRAYYGRFFELHPEPRDTSRGDRFIHATAKLHWLATLCADHRNLVLQLDADTITYGSIEPWVESLLADDDCLSMVSSWPHCFVHEFNDVLEVQKRCPALGQMHLGETAWNNGVALCRGTEATEVWGLTRRLLAELPSKCLPWGDQSAMHAAIYNLGAKVFPGPRACNHQMNFWQASLGPEFLPRSIPEDEPITIIHNCGMAKKILSAKPPWGGADKLWWHWAIRLPRLEEVVEKWTIGLR